MQSLKGEELALLKEIFSDYEREIKALNIDWKEAWYTGKAQSHIYNIKRIIEEQLKKVEQALRKNRNGIRLLVYLLHKYSHSDVSQQRFVKEEYRQQLDLASIFQKLLQTLTQQLADLQKEDPKKHLGRLLVRNGLIDEGDMDKHNIKVDAAEEEELRDLNREFAKRGMAPLALKSHPPLSDFCDPKKVHDKVEQWKDNVLSTYCINNCQSVCCDFTDHGEGLKATTTELKELVRHKSKEQIERMLKERKIFKLPKKDDRGKEWAIKTTCPAYNLGKGCLSHTCIGRPKVCGEFPIWFAGTSKDGMLTIDVRCEYMRGLFLKHDDKWNGSNYMIQELGFGDLLKIDNKALMIHVIGKEEARNNSWNLTQKKDLIQKVKDAA
ncbi:TPA: hypothetical protein HA246_07300 [Candidatus Woesearchaeota archaeon]|nr:hypothetical protein [Candidatus Woesearchaeota archaeon]